MTKSEAFTKAHAAARRAVADQAHKHPTARKSYAALFALCLRGVYVQATRPVGGYAGLSCVTLRPSQMAGV